MNSCKRKSNCGPNSGKWSNSGTVFKQCYEEGIGGGEVQVVGKGGQRSNSGQTVMAVKRWSKETGSLTKGGGQMNDQIHRGRIQVVVKSGGSPQVAPVHVGQPHCGGQIKVVVKRSNQGMANQGGSQTWAEMWSASGRDMQLRSNGQINTKPNGPFGWWSNLGPAAAARPGPGPVPTRMP